MASIAGWNGVKSLAITRRLSWEKLFIVKLQFQKRSALELVSRIPPLAGQSGGYDTPQRTRELFSRIALGFIPVIIIALFGLLSTQAVAASFDCKKATTWVEKTVCSNPELSKLDEELAKAYHDALASLSPEGQKETKQYQRQWLKEISQYCIKDKRVSDPAECLKLAYRERITQLQQSLIKFPDRIFRNVYVSQSESKETCPYVFVTKKLMYPQIENPRDENEKSWNVFISKKVSDELKSPTGGQCTDIYVENTVSFSNKRLISDQNEQWWYSQGAAHGYTNRASLNWLLEEKRELQASDLFDDKTDWIAELVALVYKKLEEEEAAHKGKYEIPPYLSFVDSPDRWVISKDGLGIQFAEYELGSRASPLIKMDWKTLDPYISKSGHCLISNSYHDADKSCVK